MAGPARPRQIPRFARNDKYWSADANEAARRRRAKRPPVWAHVQRRPTDALAGLPVGRHRSHLSFRGAQRRGIWGWVALAPSRRQIPRFARNEKYRSADADEADEQRRPNDAQPGAADGGVRLSSWRQPRGVPAFQYPRLCCDCPIHGHSAWVPRSLHGARAWKPYSSRTSGRFMPPMSQELAY